MATGPTRRTVRILIISHDLGDNSAGRAHVIWTLARHLGIPAMVLGVSRGGLWPPLLDDGFSQDTLVFKRIGDLRTAILERLTADDVLIPIKTWPNSLGVALDCGRATGATVLADIDDPDHAALVGEWSGWVYRRAFRARMRFRSESPRTFDRLQAVVRSLPRLVSNPTLRDMYGGGWIVPHARPVPTDPPPLPGGGSVRVAFVGTPRNHKGMAVLREAISAKASEGFALTVTAPPPRDAAPWESWVGTTSLPKGRQLLRESDVVVIPQLDIGYGRAQLPAKLIDAMASGRPVIASLTPPIEWALGGTGLLLEKPTVPAVIGLLEVLANPRTRLQLGQASHARARDAFSIDAVAAVLSRALRETLDARDR